MGDKLVKKVFVVGIIVLFIEACIVPSFSIVLGIKIENIETNNYRTTSSSIDWWPMYHHDLNLSGYTTSAGPITNKVLWVSEVGDGFWYDPQRSSPAVVNDTIYIGVCNPSWSKLNQISHEFRLQKNRLPLKNPFNFYGTQNENPSLERWYEAYMLCMNATTGLKKWKTRLENEFYIRGSPAVSNGKVYITATENMFGKFGHLFCLDASTGSIIWNFTLNGEQAFSPIVDNGKVYVSGWILGENSSEICKLFCLDVDTGSEVFNTSIGIGEPIDAASICNNRIYISVWDDNSYETFLYCVNTLNGTIYWNKTLQGNFLMSSPVIYNGKIFVISDTFDFQENLSCYINCFDALTGSPQWNKYIEGFANVWSTPVVAYDRIYFSVSDEFLEIGWLYCLDVTTGNIIWNKLLTQKAVLYSSPAIADGKIYINSMGVWSIHGNLYCLNAMTGDSIWQYWLLSPIYSSPAIACGRLYLASWDYFYAFDDSAPYDNSPIVTITGPKYGKIGIDYNYTILVKDPEDHDVLVIFEWSREWPGGYYSWESPSGESEVLTLYFEEEGKYWLRARARDTKSYTWSDWTVFTVTITKSKAINSSFLSYIHNFIQNHPNLFPILEKVLNLIKAGLL